MNAVGETHAFQRVPSYGAQQYLRGGLVFFASVLAIFVTALVAFSYLAESVITPVMILFQLLLFSSGMLGLIDAAARLQSRRRVSPFVEEWANVSFNLGIGFMLSFSTLDLLPVTRFIQPWLLFMVIFIGYARFGIELWQSDSDHFIVKSIHYAPAALNVGMGIFWISALANLRHVVTEITATTPDYNHLLIHVMKIAAGVMMMYLVRASVFHTERAMLTSFVPATYALIGMTIAVQTASLLSVEGQLDPFWTYMPVMMATVLYVSEHPARLASQNVAKIGMMLFSLLIAVSIVFEMKAFSFGEAWKQWGNANVGLTVNVVLILVQIGIQVRSKRRRRNPVVTEQDVREASEEIRSRHGNTVEAVDEILQVAIITRDFSYCDHIADHLPFAGDLQSYFRMYLLSAKVKMREPVTPSDLAWLFDGEEPQLSEKDLLRAFDAKYPEAVSERELAHAFTENTFITSYVHPAKVQAIRLSRSLVSRARDDLGGVVGAVIIAFFLLDALGPFLPAKIAGQLRSGYRALFGRIDIARLRLAFHYRPFDLPDWGEFYAARILDWERGAFDSLDGKSPKQLAELQHWLAQALVLNPKQDAYRFAIARDLAAVESLRGDRVRARDAFGEALAAANTDGERDMLFSDEVTIFGADFPEQPHYREMMEVAGRREYPLATAHAAKYAYARGDHQECVSLIRGARLENAPGVRGVYAFAALRAGFPREAAAIAQGFARSPEPFERIVAGLILADSEFSERKYAVAGQSLFGALLEQLRYRSFVISESEVAERVALLLACSEYAHRANEADPRHHLWNSLAFFYQRNFRESRRALDRFVRQSGATNDAMEMHRLLTGG
jgi:hypothetical protein